MPTFWDQTNIFRDTRFSRYHLKLWKTVRQTRFQNNEIIAIRFNLLQICPPVTAFDIFALLLKLPFNILSDYFSFLLSIWWQFLLLGLNFSLIWWRSSFKPTVYFSKVKQTYHILIFSSAVKYNKALLAMVMWVFFCAYETKTGILPLKTVKTWWHSNRTIWT